MNFRIYIFSVVTCLLSLFLSLNSCENFMHGKSSAIHICMVWNLCAIWIMNTVNTLRSSKSETEFSRCWCDAHCENSWLNDGRQLAWICVKSQQWQCSFPLGNFISIRINLWEIVCAFDKILSSLCEQCKKKEKQAMIIRFYYWYIFFDKWLEVFYVMECLMV